MFKQYIKLELKKSINIVKNNLLISFLIIAIMAAAFAAVNFLIGEKISAKPFKVGIVLENEDNNTKAVIRYIVNEETISSIAKFEYMDKNTALLKLSNNDVNAVLYFPEDFYNAVNVGINPKLDIVINDNSDSLTVAFSGLLHSAAGYIQTTEATVYSFISIKNQNEYQLKLKETSVGDYIAYLYGNIILRRTKIFNDIIISPTGDLGLHEYIGISAIFIWILFSITTFFPFYDKNIAFYEAIKVYGVNETIQSCIKQLIISLNIYIQCFIILIVLKIFNIINLINFKELLFLFLIILATVSLYNMIMIISANKSLAVILTYVLFFILLLCSGIVVPYSFLPVITGYIGYINPLNYSYLLLTSSMKNEINPVCIIVLLLFIVIENVMVKVCENH